MFNPYDPADIPVLILQEELKREVLFEIFKTGLVWDRRERRMLEATEVAELFEAGDTWFGQMLKA